MRKIVFISSILLFVLDVAAQQSAPELSRLLSYAGFYRIEDGGNIVISVRLHQGQPVLILTDLRNDNFRALFPGEKNRFIAGKELLKPAPVEYRIQFEENKAGEVKSLRVEQNGEQKIAQKRTARKLPVEFSNGDVQLKGDLYLPDRTPAYGAVILLSGSEEDGNRYSFDALPHILPAEGLAVLTYDKRGTGSSSGSWQHSGLEELAGDALEGLKVLLKRADIDKDNIGLIGVSEGGWVAPLVASQTDKIAYIVSISGGAFSKGYSFLHKYRVRFAEQGIQGEELEKAMSEKQAIVAQSRHRVETGAEPTGFDRRISYDPLKHWQKFHKPVLYMVGACDSLEPAKESAARFQQIFQDSRHPDYTVKIFPQAHHMMFLASSCLPSEFERMQGIAKFAPGYWETLLKWIRSRAKLTDR